MNASISKVPARSKDVVAGRAAIASGIAGLASFGLLLTFLVKRISGGDEQACVPFIRAHDIAAILQFVLMLPVIQALHRMRVLEKTSIGTKLVAFGLASAALTVACLALVFSKAIPDDLYMIPLGFFGAWLFIESRMLPAFLSKGLRRLGLVAGIGLALIGVFPIVFTAFVDPAHLLGWTPFDYQPPKGTDLPNGVSHIVLVLGTFSGLTTLPIWTMLVGRKLKSS